MKLERLALKGFMRFAGAVEIDLTAIPEGLVAVVGGNGAGKTTLLDAGAAVLHLAMPSREGALATYATGRDSYLEAIYAIEGRGRYRCRVNVDGERRGSDAVLEQLDGDQVGRLNDGKVTTYRKAIDGLFPAPEVLLASAFAPQNRAGSFVDAKPAQRKDLFSRLLGLELFERYAETAKTCAAIVDATVGRLRDRRDTLARRTTPEIGDELNRRGRQLSQDRDDAAADEKLQRAIVATAQAERVGMVAAVDAHRAAQARAQLAGVAVQGLLTAQATNKAQRAQVEQAYEAGVAQSQGAFSRTLATLDAEADAATRACAETVEQLSTRIAGNETLSARAAEIRKASADKTLAEGDLETWRNEEAGARKALDAALEQVEHRRRKLAEAERYEREFETATRQAELLASVPCGGGPILLLGASDRVDAGGCQFLQDATAAAARLPELAGAANHAPALRDGIDHWEQQAAQWRRDVATAADQVQRTKALIAKLAPTAKFVEQLAATEERIAGYRREQAAAEQTRNGTIERLKVARVGARRAADTEQTAAREHRDTRLQALTAEAIDLAQQLVDAQRAAGLALEEAEQSAGAVASLAALDLALEAAREALTVAVSMRATAAAALDAWLGERTAFVRAQAEITEVAGKVGLAEDELLAWQTLQRCFSRDGLPTLEIGNAGPTVSALTNDLLNVGFGPRFTVDVVTQVARADGKGLKEDFTIRVFDNQEGGEPRDIADLSGGERVLVEEALRAAIALFVNSRNVQPVRTIWRDETTGALDAENAVRYVAMLRRVQQLGGIAHVLFVTHNADCAALADAQVLVRDGQVQIVRPPFPQAA